MHRAPLFLELRRLATVTLLALASCSGEAATTAPPAAPASPSAEVWIAAPPASTPAPPAAPEPAPPAAPEQAPPAASAPTWIPDKSFQSSIRLENITALNAARVPFAQYLNEVHHRIHPIFSDQFLASLAKAPGSWPADLRTDLELVIDHTTGRLKRMGVVRSSGSTAFDVGVLEAVQKAQPFGPAPGVIASPDGNVYIRWEFHRDPIEGCSTRNARPYLLKIPP